MQQIIDYIGETTRVPIWSQGLPEEVSGLIQFGYRMGGLARTATSTLPFWTIFFARISQLTHPTRACDGFYIVPVLIHADWGLRSYAMTNSRLQGSRACRTRRSSSGKICHSIACRLHPCLARPWWVMGCGGNGL